MSTEKESPISLLKGWLLSNIVLILILTAAAAVWTWVFSSACLQFIASGAEPFRGAWNGVGHFELFGYTVNFDFEGYLDYDYYYNSWGSQFLNGIMPYTNLFNQISFGGHLYNVPYFLPPLYVYMCALGRSLPIDPFGIGLVITVFGFLTAFPIYGISSFLSKNRRVAEISVLAYLFNPVVLYYTVFEWLNPAPFVFFMTLSFFLLMRGKRISGSLAMVTAVLFKQTAIFLALPVIAFIIKRPSQPSEGETDVNPRDEFDLRGFTKTTIVVVLYLVTISIPYLLNPGNYFYYLLIRPGGVLLTNLQNLPAPGQPVTLASLLIFLGAPTPLIDIVNKAVYYGFPLVFSSITIFAVMLFRVRSDLKPETYWRRILYLALLLILTVHLFSPRGIFKYYLVALIPFLSIQSVSSMISAKADKVKASFFMILNPILLGLLILIINRYVDIVFLLLFFFGYLCHKQFSLVQEMVRDGLNLIDNKVKQLFAIED
jgi:hypothetical protein